MADVTRRESIENDALVTLVPPVGVRPTPTWTEQRWVDAGQRMASLGHVEEMAPARIFSVGIGSGSVWVVLSWDYEHCSCKDWTHRTLPCEHIEAARAAARSGAPVPNSASLVFTAPVSPQGDTPPQPPGWRLFWTAIAWMLYRRARAPRAR